MSNKTFLIFIAAVAVGYIAADTVSTIPGVDKVGNLGFNLGSGAGFSLS